MSERISDEMLSAFFDGEASPEEAARIERSLETNPELVKKLDEWKSLRRAIEKLPTYRSSEGMHRSIMSAISRSQFDSSGTDHDDLKGAGQGNAAKHDPIRAAVNEEIPAEPLVEVAGRNDANRQWRWAIALFTTVAAMLLIALFYNPPGRLAINSEVARDDAAVDQREEMDQDNSRSAEKSSAMQMSRAPEGPNDALSTAPMMQRMGDGVAAPENEAAPGAEPGGGFGGGGGETFKMAPNLTRSEPASPGRPDQPQAGADIAAAGIGGQSDSHRMGKGAGPDTPRGGGAGPGGVQIANAPTERRVVPESNFVGPTRSRGGRDDAESPREVTDQDLGNRVASNRDGEADRLAEDRQQMFPSASGDNFRDEQAGRFYAVVDLNTPLGRDSVGRDSEGKQTDEVGGVLALEMRGETLSDRQQTDESNGLPENELAFNAPVPAWLRELGFVQLERVRNQKDQSEQQLGIVDQIVANQDRDARFRLVPAAADEQRLLSPSVETQPDHASLKEPAAEGMATEAGAKPTTVTADSSNSRGTRVEFYEFEADAADVNQLITMLAEQGANVNLFYNQSIGSVGNTGDDTERSENDQPVTGVDTKREAKIAATERPAAMADIQENQDKSSGTEVAQGDPRNAVLEPSEVSEDQHYFRSVTRLGWDAVELRPLSETRSAERAMVQQGQQWADSSDAGNGNQSRSLGRSGYAPPEGIQAGGKSVQADQAPPTQDQPHDDPARVANVDSGADTSGADTSGANAFSAAEAAGNLVAPSPNAGRTGDATMTLDDLSRSLSSYFWRGQSFVESTAVDANRAEAMGGERDASVGQGAEEVDNQDAVAPSQRPRPPRPLPRDTRPKSAPSLQLPSPQSSSSGTGEQSIQGADRGQQDGDASTEPTAGTGNRLVPQFSRPGRVRLTLIVRTPIASETNPTPAQEGEAGRSNEDDGQPSNPAASGDSSVDSSPDSSSGNDR